jgi:Tfp pilus assembly protein PilF
MRRALLLLLAPTLLTSCVYWTPMSRDISSQAVVLPDVPMQKWDIKSCGAGSLTAVLHKHGDTKTMEAWDAELPKTRGGVMSIDLVHAARSRGFDASLVTGSRDIINAELKADRPVILMLKVIQAPGKSFDFFHYIVIDGYDPEKRLYRTQFGDGHARWTPLERLLSAWKSTKNAMILVHPKNPHAAALRAAVQLEEQGKYALAADAYREILRQDPKSLLAWTNLGNAEMRAGRRPAAEDAFRKAIEVDPEAADALNNLAWLLFEDKRIDEAEPIARRAVVAPAPDPWSRLDTLARILMARGECAEARIKFRQALEQIPESRTAERADIEAAAGTLAECTQTARADLQSATN